MGTVSLKINCDDEYIWAECSTYSENIEEYIYSIKEEADIKIENSSNYIDMEIQCTKDDFLIYQTIKKYCKTLPLSSDLFVLYDKDVVKVSLMYYFLSNFNKSALSNIIHENENENEYIKYLEKNNEIEKFFSSGSNEDNFRFVSIIFIAIIIIPFIFNGYLGSSMLILYVIGAIWANKTDTESKKEREKEKSINHTINKTIYYAKIFEKNLIKEEK